MLNGDDNEKGFKTNASNKQKQIACSTLFLFFFSFFLFLFQYNFIEHTHVQLTFTKDNLQQNENYHLKLTKKET